jgi:glycosyltransferase involved in cell wall biosynthesis
VLADARLTNVVSLVGPKSQRDIAERLRNAAMFVLPCKCEADGGMDNLPTVIMEAMAAGLPVISTSAAGVPEMVQSGVNGELVNPGDVTALAAAIKHLISDRSAAATFGERGRAIAVEKFSIEANVRALASILQRHE